MKAQSVVAVAMTAVLSLAPMAALAGKPKQIEPPATIRLSEAENVEALSAMWIDGKRQELNGLEALKDAEKALRKAEKSAVKDESRVEKADTAVAERQNAYRRLVSTFGAVTEPGAIDAEIKSLKRAQDNWSDAENDLGKARDNLSKSQAEITAAASAVRTANEAVALGRDKMETAEARALPASGPMQHPAGDEPLTLFESNVLGEGD